MRTILRMRVQIKHHTQPPIILPQIPLFHTTQLTHQTPTTLPQIPINRRRTNKQKTRIRLLILLHHRTYLRRTQPRFITPPTPRRQRTILIPHLHTILTIQLTHHTNIITTTPISTLTRHHTLYMTPLILRRSTHILTTLFPIYLIQCLIIKTRRSTTLPSPLIQSRVTTHFFDYENPTRTLYSYPILKNSIISPLLLDRNTQ